MTKNPKPRQITPRPSQKSTNNRTLEFTLGLVLSSSTTLKFFSAGLNPRRQTNIRIIAIIRSLVLIEAYYLQAPAPSTVVPIAVPVKSDAQNSLVRAIPIPMLLPITGVP